MADKIGPIADPELNDIILKLKNDVAYSLFCVQIGTIELYNAATNSANISINFKRKFPDGTIGTYPLLVDCPVYIVSGGDACLTMPITKGDQCIILFNDRNIDNWYYSGAIDVPDTPRAHNVSDAIALVGIRNLKTARLTPSSAAGINAGSKKLYFKNDIANFKTLIDSLFTVLDTALVQGPAPYPFTVTTKTALSNLKAQFDLLLDEGLS
jgi:hypothetical protein